MSAGEQSAESVARKPRALAPGSFLRHMLSSKHTATQQPFSDLEITAQAFIFLLAGQSHLGRRPLSSAAAWPSCKAVHFCLSAVGSGASRGWPDYYRIIEVYEPPEGSEVSRVARPEHVCTGRRV